MLAPIIDEIKKEYLIILASESINRRQILKNAGLNYDNNDFIVSASGFAEDLPKN